MGEPDDILYPYVGVYILIHVAGFAAIWTGVTTEALALCVVLYWLRMFAICAGYHRYFAHRSYSTSRLLQFILAFLAQTSAQKSVLWWAAKHRHHHLHSDTEQDVHSPRRKGFWYAHLGWIFTVQHDNADLSKVPDLTGYPELIWLHRFETVPAVALAIITFVVAGWPGLVIGFFWSTILVYHATFCINSLAHIHGRKRYVTGDESRNNLLLALITMGEGWHNNHHAYPSSVRQGFRWWEIDPTYYILIGLRGLGLVWDLKSPPEAVLRNERRLGSRVVERAAAELASTFDAESIVSALIHERAASSLTTLQKTLAAQDEALDSCTGIAVPHLPTRDEIWHRAATMFATTPSLDDIVERAYGMILDAVSARLAAVS